LCDGALLGAELERLGYTVHLIAPADVKPLVMRRKNDDTDAEVIYETVSRLSIRFVPLEAQSNVRACADRYLKLLVRQQTMRSNAIAIAATVSNPRLCAFGREHSHARRCTVSSPVAAAAQHHEARRSLRPKATDC
jgi:hypothetical protein